MSTGDDIVSLARLAAGGYVRTLEWIVRGALGVVEGNHAAPAASAPPTQPEADAAAAAAGLSLRERGEELLRRSADVREDEESHPAYERILDEILPDEARILRLMFIAGPQPAVDVRAGAIPLNATTELVAPGLTMIGAEAGCRRPERMPAYLNNLNRLGLVWFSREPVAEQSRYQVLESQPDVIEALEAKGRSRTVRRSIGLTPFGTDFCERVLPPTTAEFDAL